MGVGKVSSGHTTETQQLDGDTTAKQATAKKKTVDMEIKPAVAAPADGKDAGRTQAPNAKANVPAGNAVPTPGAVDVHFDTRVSDSMAKHGIWSSILSFLADIFCELGGANTRTFNTLSDDDRKPLRQGGRDAGKLDTADIHATYGKPPLKEGALTRMRDDIEGALRQKFPGLPQAYYKEAAGEVWRGILESAYPDQAHAAVAQAGAAPAGGAATVKPAKLPDPETFSATPASDVKTRAAPSDVAKLNETAGEFKVAKFEKTAWAKRFGEEALFDMSGWRAELAAADPPIAKLDDKSNVEVAKIYVQRKLEQAEAAYAKGDYATAEKCYADLGFPMPDGPLSHEAQRTLTILGVLTYSEDKEGNPLAPDMMKPRSSSALRAIEGAAHHTALMADMQRRGVTNLSDPPTQENAIEYIDHARRAADPRTAANESKEAAHAAHIFARGSLVHYNETPKPAKNDPDREDDRSLTFGAVKPFHSFLHDKDGAILSDADGKPIVFESKPDESSDDFKERMGKEARKRSKEDGVDYTAAADVTKTPNSWKDVSPKPSGARNEFGARAESDCESEVYTYLSTLGQVPGFTVMGAIYVAPDKDVDGSGMGHAVGVIAAPDGTVYVTSNTDEPLAVVGTGANGQVTQADIELAAQLLCNRVYNRGELRADAEDAKYGEEGGPVLYERDADGAVYVTYYQLDRDEDKNFVAVPMRERVDGSGPNGAITADDLERAINRHYGSNIDPLSGFTFGVGVSEDPAIAQRNAAENVALKVGVTSDTKSKKKPPPLPLYPPPFAEEFILPK